MVKHAKPKGFYDQFLRKAPEGGPAAGTTHYCPGCGHGTVHKLIAEAIEDMNIKDRTIFLSPVGCSVFAYYYMDAGNIQCAHGRAPAVGTGASRTREDAIVISYQGDGDLAGIGTAEIIHAANRGENMAVFFVNNAIYGMTGGQLAPTTLLGQTTATTPFGRLEEREGKPIHMAEVVSTLEGPVYVERTTLSDARGVMKTRKAIRKALLNQVEHRGFSFVEILSPCPIGWKMAPVQARSWMKDNLEPVYEVKQFRNIEDKIRKSGRLPEADDAALLDMLVPKMEETALETSILDSEKRIKIAGFGGQGVLSAGTLLANAAIAEGLEATWLPSYGAEMRGGTANASVVLSSLPVGSPVVSSPTALLAMNGPSLDSFESAVVPGGLIVVNSSLVKRKVDRDDVRVIYAPVSAIASEVGFLKGANIVMLALYLFESGAPGIDALKSVLPKLIKKSELVELNLKLIKRAEEFYAAV
ncbi:MAG: 2-oxoacid:acceptor oxidoreductase family protein [Spirochaetales bacterium]|uniref:2-oxoacid:acceptor oxidoreductase family protein n=1 Tax=Candidatus Thalassospirochaeta sargassi TaxID=3119039 RepID=A0AAJ1MLT7_9SPIO|nr:2-oxoacid:acceptor oxidoreductase family protein [Spirochaetales bacterium]